MVYLYEQTINRPRCLPHQPERLHIRLTFICCCVSCTRSGVLRWTSSPVGPADGSPT